MKLGFIGTGNMAGAIIGGILKKGIVKADDIIGADVLEAGREKVKAAYGIRVTDNNIEVVDNADIMFLSVSKKIKRTVRHQLHLAKMYLYYNTLTKKGCRLPATAFDNISLYLP